MTKESILTSKVDKSGPSAPVTSQGQRIKEIMPLKIETGVDRKKVEIAKSTERKSYQFTTESKKTNT